MILVHPSKRVYVATQITAVSPAERENKKAAIEALWARLEDAGLETLRFPGLRSDGQGLFKTDILDGVLQATFLVLIFEGPSDGRSIELCANLWLAPMMGLTPKPVLPCIRRGVVISGLSLDLMRTHSEFCASPLRFDGDIGDLGPAIAEFAGNLASCEHANTYRLPKTATLGWGSFQNVA